MTHEVRVPLNGILGMTGLALQTELQADQREYLELVQSSAEVLLSLVNDVLDFSKHEVGKLALDSCEFSLRSLLRDVLRPLALRASASGLAFESVVEDGVPDELTGNPLRLGQILRNLAGNASKFTTWAGWRCGYALNPSRDAGLYLGSPSPIPGLVFPPKNTEGNF